MEPPCIECRPELDPENMEAMEVFITVQNQCIMPAMGEPVDLDFKAIAFVMDLYQVEDRLGTFEKVRKLFKHFKDMRNVE